MCCRPCRALRSSRRSSSHDTFDSFEIVEPGQLTAEQYDEFVRDTVNFLEYAGEPVQVYRQSLGIWVLLFLCLFTALAWLLKREYWRDVK